MIIFAFSCLQADDSEYQQFSKWSVKILDWESYGTAPFVPMGGVGVSLDANMGPFLLHGHLAIPYMFGYFGMGADGAIGYVFLSDYRSLADYSYFIKERIGGNSLYDIYEVAEYAGQCRAAFLHALEAGISYRFASNYDSEPDDQYMLNADTLQQVNDWRAYFGYRFVSVYDMEMVEQAWEIGIRCLIGMNSHFILKFDGLYGDNRTIESSQLGAGIFIQAMDLFDVSAGYYDDSIFFGLTVNFPINVF
jgi:hypothetical protein